MLGAHMAWAAVVHSIDPDNNNLKEKKLSTGTEVLVSSKPILLNG